MKLKVQNNLFIVDSKIVSYETVVAAIKNNCIIANGVYSRTTGKQVARLSGLTKFELIKSKVKREYDEFSFGAKCNIEGAISEKGTTLILGKVRSGYSLQDATVFVLSRLGKKDRALALQQLGSVGYTERKIKTLTSVFEMLDPNFQVSR